MNRQYTDMVCPECNSTNVVLYEGVYIGDSGCRHTGFEIECSDCKHSSGWWKTIEECKERFE